MGKRVAYHLVLCQWSDVATFRIQTLNFTRVVHLNWLVKLELRERGPSGRQYCCYLLLYAKNAKRN